MDLAEKRNDLTKHFQSGLQDNIFVKEISAKKAARVLLYWKETEGGFLNRRISEIWKGMRKLEIEPYIEAIESDESKILNPYDSKVYSELDSIAIGVGVCVHKGFLNTLEGHTQYSLSAKGAQFIER
ncbi:hypothetical protein KAI04_00270 [Candidatus Pacearchaeota archaeon]|nr:hypothetical protein [Candidatus Pacearchaeota archaeon]